MWNQADKKKKKVKMKLKRVIWYVALLAIQITF